MNAPARIIRVFCQRGHRECRAGACRRANRPGPRQSRSTSTGLRACRGAATLHRYGRHACFRCLALLVRRLRRRPRLPASQGGRPGLQGNRQLEARRARRTASPRKMVAGLRRSRAQRTGGPHRGFQQHPAGRGGAVSAGAGRRHHRQFRAFSVDQRRRFGQTGPALPRMGPSPPRWRTRSAPVWRPVGNSISGARCAAARKPAGRRRRPARRTLNRSASAFMPRWRRLTSPCGSRTPNSGCMSGSSRTTSRFLKITQNRYAQGVDTRADVAAAETQLKTAQAQAIDLTLQRAQLEHAIAVLLGQPPAAFSLPPADLTIQPPLRRPGVGSLATARTPARHRRGGTPAGRGLRRDRRGQGRLFSRDLAFGLRRVPRVAIPAASSARRMRSGRSAPGRSCPCSKPARSAPRSGRPAPPTKKAWPPTGRRSSPPSRRWKTTLPPRPFSARRCGAGRGRGRGPAVRGHHAQSIPGRDVSYLNVVTAQAAQLAAERTAVQLLGRQLNASVTLLKAAGGMWNTADTKGAR